MQTLKLFRLISLKLIEVAEDLVENNKFLYGAIREITKQLITNKQEINF